MGYFACYIEKSVKQKVFETIQHENDIEDIKNTIEVEDDLIYDHIRDISIDTMNRMAYLKREKEDNGMAWNDAASAAFCTRLHGAGQQVAGHHLELRAGERQVQMVGAVFGPPQ